MLTPSGSPALPRLSKSRFLAGLQCHKRLYLELHAPELAAEVDSSTQAVLVMGNRVGELARQRFPGGVLVECDHRHPTAALQRTAELLNDGSVSAIFEGAFAYEHVLVRVDILERLAPEKDAAGTWRLIEVKASTRAKEVHLDDLALQSYVLAGAGVALAGAWLMHVNTEYLYPGGELDLGHLFALRDLTAVTAARMAQVPGRLTEMLRMLEAASPPPIEPDQHCHRPHTCPFWEHCTRHKPARWVYYLPESHRTIPQLMEQGIETIDEIPDGFKLSPLQRRVKEDMEWVGPGLKAALESVRYPVHHLDFETVMPAIPQYPNTRPYQVLPVQWSNHIETEDGSLRHEEFLYADPKDPREAVAHTLLESVGREGSICIYSEYERHILRELAQAVPSLKRELEQVISRLWDLLPIIRTYYYHPEFRGSFSIKAVLAALDPSLHYGDLEIQDGASASHAYYRMVFEETDLVEKARLHTALLTYCARDTLALVVVRKVLFQKALGCAS